MPYQITLLLLGLSLCLCLCRRCSRYVTLTAILPMYAAFVLIYLFVSEDVAQDRDAYYQWYLDAERAFFDSPSQTFSFLLRIMPDGLSAHEFGVVTSSAMFLVIVFLLVNAARQGIIQWNTISLIILVAVCDRMFLDLVMNTLRSSLAAVIFLIGVLLPGWWRRIGLWGTVIGIHTPAAIVMMGIYAVFCLTKWPPRILFLLMGGAVGLFAVRVWSGAKVITDKSFFEWVIALIGSESVVRGVTMSSEMTNSLAMQLVLGIVGPWVLLVIWSRVGARGYTKNTNIREPEREVLALTLGTAVAALALYPDLSLAQRLFVIPILSIPLFLPYRVLVGLVVVKFAVFAAVMQRHLL